MLLVDDNHFVREAVATAIYDDTRFAVIGEAASGEEAIESARRLRPSLILMDINLPGISGIEATRKIRAEHPDLRVVGLSVQNDPETRRSMLEAGAEALLCKAGDFSDFLERLFYNKQTP